MKILHILNTNRFSGAENVVCQIIGMMKDVPEIEMIYCSLDGQIRETLSERGIVFSPVQSMSVREVKRVIKEEKPDIIHAHDMRAGFMAALSCGNIPLVSHIHNNAFDSRKPTLKAILYRYAAKKAKHIFWVSSSSFSGYYFHKGLEEKSSVLYNVIDMGELNEKSQVAENKNNYDIVYLGRLTYPKNPQRLISVLEKIIYKNSDVTVALIGTGELESEVTNLIKVKGLNKNIHYLGFINNPYGILAHAKVMLMTSRWEGTPMCALEAMTLGVPIVSTPTDGMKDLIDNGKNGYLSDKDEDLVKHVIEIIEDDCLQHRFSENILDKAREYNNLRKYRKSLLDVYNTLS